ncbi:DNA topoisomerase-3 [Alteribacillus persepolensis]|uniref:DNA topoisomerase 3 n=1 Tax=Alteribacillus persepolensis TaxID=568899 RepID=A0A1G8C5E4_9BACI|nr:DNA topoisomerase III [Alteribacillus persepolensis]SDH40489.1 DNA topoisomerase-3 [Alteribacillus persepolensis]
MSKSVILAEKPSVGKDIARVLGCDKQGKDFMEGKKYIVTWAFGHLVTLAEPETYDSSYKTWKLEDLPMLPDKLKLSVIPKTGKQFSVVKRQLHRNDVKDIIIATDAGREGELVARWIIDKARVKKPVKRLWISSVTEKAIKQGFQNLKDGRKFHSLYEAAQARSEADWYVGMNATRALTTKFNASLSCGRVQTPTLAMVARREREVASFTPDEFYQIRTAAKNGTTFWWRHPKNNDTRIFSKEKKDRILQKIQNEDMVIKKVEKKKKHDANPSLFDLTELQREASSRFGYSAKETLNVLQRLYERHKVLTYPRTDSRYLSSDIKSTLKDRLKACDTGNFSKHVLTIKKNSWMLSSSMINDKKVSDHHAIIPTEEPPRLFDMTSKEKKLYELVVQRFLAGFFPTAQFEQTVIEGHINDETFAAKEQRMLRSGWKAVYQGGSEQQHNKFSRFTENEKIRIVEAAAEKGETAPPSRFNEGTLLSAMENPSRFMAGEDKQLVHTLKTKGGIGTVATRADIIEKLLNSQLLEKRGKSLFTTLKGRQLLDLVPDELKSPTLTAEWEQKLEDIERGKLHRQAFISDMKGYAKDVVQNIKSSTKSFKHDNITGTPCPKCGKLLLEVNGKYGKRKVCQDKACGYKKNISKITNARCPQCKKKMELRGEGEGQIFVCRCGYKEKVSSFNKRRQKEKQNKASKHDVKKYLKHQQDDEMKNPALAEALQNLKQKNDKK